MTREDRIADLASATAENPKDATFLILNPNFSRFADTDVWSIQSGNSNLSGGEDTNRCAEVYMSTFTLAQELTVPNGLYTFTGQGAVTYHDDRTIKEYDGGAKPELYLGDATLGFEEMIEGDKLSNMNQLSGSFSSGLYQLGPSDVVTVVNGKVTIGARCERADIWAIWDNFQLKYLGEVKDLGPYVEAYEKAYAEAEQLFNSGQTIGNSAQEKLGNALNSTKNVNKKSKEALENATALLQEAIAAAKTSIASYKVIESGEVPNDDIAGWTCTNEQPFHVNTWSVEGNEDGTGMVTPFIENWINSGNGVLGDGMVYYTLEGLNPGEEYYAQALVRAYSEAGNEVSGLTFFVNGKSSYEKDVLSSGTAFTYGNLQGVYGTFGSTVTVGDDGIITIGVKIADATFNWVALKNVTITKSENVSKINGDSNGDGIVNITDAMCNVDYILGKEVSPFIFSNADYNEDGVCDVTDVMLIVDYILGKPQQPTQYYLYIGTVRPTADNITSSELKNSSILYETSKPAWSINSKGTLNVTNRALYWLALPVSWGNITIQYGAFPVAQANMDDDTGEVFENITINGVEHIVRRFVLGVYPFEVWFDDQPTTAEYWYVGTELPTVSSIRTKGTPANELPTTFVSTTVSDKGDNCYFIYPKSWGTVTICLDEERTDVSAFEYFNTIYEQFPQYFAEYEGIAELVNNYHIWRNDNSYPNAITYYLKWTKDYYWYVGNANDPMPTTISPIVTDNTSVGWRLIGSTLTNGQQIWDETYDIQIVPNTESKVYQRIIINSDNVDLNFYDSFGTLLTDFISNKEVINGWSVFTTAAKSKTFSIITKIELKE